MGIENREAVRNKQVIFRGFIANGVFPKESDVEVTEPTIELTRVVAESSLVKNLYLSCDPYMRARMLKLPASAQSYLATFRPGSVG